MADLIERSALEELFREVIGGIAKKPEMNGNLEHMVRASAMVIEMIKDAPAVDAVPVVHGRWMFPYRDRRYKKCSACGREYYSIPSNSHYCPNCGARMDGKDGNDGKT